MGKKNHDSETPTHGEQVISACAFIHKDFEGVEKLFLAKRADTKKFLPGLFELPGGHIDYGEDLVEGLRRELHEEFDMSIKVGDVFAAFTYENSIKGSHAVEVIYFATFVEPVERITLNPEDHSTYEWFTAKEILSRREEIVPHAQVTHQQADDPEYLTMVRGFELLNGATLRLGTD